MNIRGYILQLLILSVLALPVRAQKAESPPWYVPHGAGVSPGQFSYHTVSQDPGQRLAGYTLGGRAMVFWENEHVRFGPVFFSGTTLFREQANAGKGLIPSACTECYYFSGERKETGGGGMFETNLEINRGLWSFFRPLFGSEVTFVHINQTIDQVYYKNGRIRQPPVIDYTGNQNYNEIRLGVYLGAESRFNDFISLRVTSSLDLAARNWTILPLGYFLFLPIPLEGTNLRLSPLHSLMIVVRIR
jgi:hypothetical protein